MKLVELFGNTLLTGTAAWALITTKSAFQYDSLSYSFFLSIGVSGLVSNITDNCRVTRFNKMKSRNSLAFATSLLSTEICLVAGMDRCLASSNLIIPLINLMTNQKDDEKILETGRWYSVLLTICSLTPYEMKIGYILAFVLLLTDPKVSKYTPFLMAVTICLSVPCLNILKAVVK